MSDRGTEFLNDIINELCQLLSIKKVYTNAYHPQANGGTERVHRFINDSVSMHITKGAGEKGLATIFMLAKRGGPERGALH